MNDKNNTLQTNFNEILRLHSISILHISKRLMVMRSNMLKAVKTSSLVYTK